MWSSVDLPAPDGPMIETNSPGVMSKAIRRSTNVWPAPTGNDFSTPRMDITGVPGSRLPGLGDAVGGGTLEEHAGLLARSGVGPPRSCIKRRAA